MKQTEAAPPKQTRDSELGESAPIAAEEQTFIRAHSRIVGAAEPQTAQQVQEMQQMIKKFTSGD